MRIASACKSFAALTSEEAENAARKAIREQKKQERKEILQQRVDALKAKFRKQ